ncbi:MAG: VOC family protein [Gammaproteobacteria bacterium]
MIGYVTIGTNDLERGAKFYDALLADLGAKRAMEMDRLVAWASAPNTPMLVLIKPADGNPAAPGNGNMVAIMCDSEEAIKALHAKALELGGTDEGAPGPRGDGFYGAYFRDLDGNKLVFFKMG